MKKVVANEELQEYMIRAIDLICEPVKTTLGPIGRNVIIDHGSFSPFITNDGVTIASNIESEDPVINAILELAKEASVKTNENVGDGTTTTLVLLESIFKEGLKAIKAGYNSIILKNDLNANLEKIIEILKKESKKPRDEDIYHIASVAASDTNIGRILSDAYRKVGANNIRIKEYEEDKTAVNCLYGYFFETIIASPYFFKNDENIIINNPKILVTNKELESINIIDKIINYLYKTNESLIIIAKNYSDEFINEIVSMYYENDLKIILLKSPGYGEEEQNILSDISIITNTNILYKIEDINISDLGSIKEIEIRKEITKLNFNTTNKIKERILELESKKDLVNEHLKESYQNRLAMLKTGIIEILVGASTTTERREKKMRFDDALCAITSADMGVLPGSGQVLAKISNTLKEDNISTKILKVALTKPLYQILENAALDPTLIIDKIKEENYSILYNVNSNTYESVLKTTVIDTTSVVINSLKNSCSIASMLLTTNSLIINESNNTYNKINDYTEI